MSKVIKSLLYNNVRTYQWDTVSKHYHVNVTHFWKDIMSVWHNIKTTSCQWDTLSKQIMSVSLNIETTSFQFDTISKQHQVSVTQFRNKNHVIVTQYRNSITSVWQYQNNIVSLTQYQNNIMSVLHNIKTTSGESDTISKRHRVSST